MPLVWLLGAALFCLAAAPIGSVADLDRDNGTPDAKLGAPVAAFHGLVLTEDAGRWLTYKAPGEKLSYAGFEVTGIKYNFFKGTLYSINISVDGRRSTRGILKALENSYGATHTLEKHRLTGADTDLEVREWTGQKAYLLYKSASNFDGAEVIILDRPRWDQMQIPREQRKEEFRKMLGGSFTNGDF